jgi:hypothetical protein
MNIEAFFHVQQQPVEFLQASICSRRACCSPTMLHATFLAHMQIPGCQNAYCKYEVVAGEDWQILDGMDNGITQVAQQSSGWHVKRGLGKSRSMNRNMPFDASSGCVLFRVGFHCFCSSQKVHHAVRALTAASLHAGQQLWNW